MTGTYTAAQYSPNLRSVKRHEVPEWYHDAKFGIFIHWGLYSIPAFAPTGRGDHNRIMREEGYGSYFTNMPYAEWYVNSIRIQGSPARKYHEESYGKDFSYFDFAGRFNAAARGWDPAPWADLFRAAGARYCVLVTKHMDGFCMWPPENTHYGRPGYHATRDIVGELTGAVRSRGLKMGYYYSSALDLSLTNSHIYDIPSFYLEGGPIDESYTRYQLSHWLELIDTHKPSILWGDICYPPRHNLYELFARYYNTVPEGVVNDRWARFPMFFQWFGRTGPGRELVNRYAMSQVRKGREGNPQPKHYDFSTPEYSTRNEISVEKWEACRGVGLSFAYNRMEPPESYLTSEEAVRLLVDIVSKNGNLLLNLGPMADGTIPDIQKECVLGVGRWLETNGEAVYGTRPWTRAEGKTADGIDVRYTRRGEDLYMTLLGTPERNTVVVPGLKLDRDGRAELLNSGSDAILEDTGTGCRLIFTEPPAESPAHVIKFSGVLN